MKHMVVSAVIAIGFSICPAMASQDDATLLDSYMSQVTLSGGGMCDGMRSTIVLFTGPDHRVELFVPATDSTQQFYAVTTQDGTDYFVKVTDESVEVTKLDPMDAWAKIAQLSLNYSTSLFFPNKPSDCAKRNF